MNLIKNIGKKNLVSIIVPIYNIEDYIDRCINSIVNQTYKKLEIMLVDDGSTDSSLKKCKEWEQKDKRIRLFHINNSGPGGARNYALDRIQGEFVTFIDGDDFVTNDFIETMVSLIQNNDSDLSVCINTIYYEDGTNKHVYANHNGKKIITRNNFEMLEEMLYQKKFDTTAWTKMYKSYLFKDIRFPKDKLYEDLDTIYKVFLNSKKITYINKEMYYYFQRSTSIVGKPFDKSDMYIIDAINNMLEIIIKVDNENKLNGHLINSCISKLLSVNFYILRRTKIEKKYDEYNTICINNIKKYMRFNMKARLKNNIAIVLFMINPKLIVIFQLNLKG